jgi:hypothetical protein
MSKRRLVIHAGFHKSGTTALQEAFDSQSEELRERGIIYPNIGRKAHHRIAWALTDLGLGKARRRKNTASQMEGIS